MQYHSTNKKRIFKYKRFKQKRKLTEEQKLGKLKYDIRHSREMYEWKQKILMRDNYTCQLCEKKSQKGKLLYLQVHHITRFSVDIQNGNFKNIFSPLNGVCLCSHCHNEIKDKEELYEDYFKHIAKINSKKHRQL